MFHVETKHAETERIGSFDGVVHSSIFVPESYLQTERMYIRKDIGTALRERRNELRLSRKEVADDSNITEQALGRIERGVQRPRSDTLMAILGTLKMQFDDIDRYAKQANDAGTVIEPTEPIPDTVDSPNERIEYLRQRVEVAGELRKALQTEASLLDELLNSLEKNEKS